MFFVAVLLFSPVSAVSLHPNHCLLLLAFGCRSSWMRMRPARQPGWLWGHRWTTWLWMMGEGTPGGGRGLHVP